MATESVTAEQDNINRKHDGADADAERTAAGHRIVEPKGFPNVVTQNQNENEREIQKIAVHILHDQRERTFTEISFARFADRARGRVGPKCFVIGAAIIITGEPKSARRPQD